MKTILITGSTGFIGIHLVAHLLNKKHRIIGLTNIKNKVSNVFTLHEDVRTLTPSKLPQNISTIIHLAALSDIVLCQKNPSLCFENNISGTANMIEIARKKDSNFIFMSTSHVYGNPKDLPVKESAELVSTSVYSASKILGEKLCETYAEQYGINATSLRLFSVYGPKSPSHNVVYKIINQLKSSSLIQLGNTKSKRDFVFIDDVVNAVSRVITLQKKYYNVYNIASNKSISIQEICNKLIKISKKDTGLKISKNLIRKNDVADIRGDYSKIKNHFKWEPKTTIDEGLKKTYCYYVKK